MFIILFGFYVLYVTYKFAFCVVIKPTGICKTYNDLKSYILLFFCLIFLLNMMEYY